MSFRSSRECGCDEGCVGSSFLSAVEHMSNRGVQIHDGAAAVFHDTDPDIGYRNAPSSFSGVDDDASCDGGAEAPLHQELLERHIEDIEDHHSMGCRNVEIYKDSVSIHEAFLNNMDFLEAQNWRCDVLLYQLGCLTKMSIPPVDVNVARRWLQPDQTMMTTAERAVFARLEKLRRIIVNLRIVLEHVYRCCGK